MLFLFVNSFMGLGFIVKSPLMTAFLNYVKKLVENSCFSKSDTLYEYMKEAYYYPLISMCCSRTSNRKISRLYERCL